jgi:hypothetical protein
MLYEARRKALAAIEKRLESTDTTKLPLPDKVLSDISDCTWKLEMALKCYDLAAQAAFEGTHEDWMVYSWLATHYHDEYNKCSTFKTGVYPRGKA